MADQKNPLVLHPLVPKELLPAPRWLIRGVIPLGHSPSEIFITVLFGPGGTFKTYTFISWAVCMALARDWFGHKVRPGINVLYIAADDPGGPQPRGQAWAGFFELTLEDLDQLGERARLIKGAINFFETEEVDWAIEELKRIGFKPTVVFIDTYFHSSQGADISTSVKDNLQVIGNIRRFAEEVGAEAIVVSDHSPKDGRSLFGSVIKGVTIDVLWEAQTTEGSETSGTITNTRMRNAPMSPPLALEFEQVDHETLPDEDGQSIFPQLVLADARVSQAKPEAKSLSEKERKQKLDAMIVAACYVIGENWEIGQKIPSRRDFRKMAEAKFKAQTGSEQGIGSTAFGKVLDNLVDRKILVRIGQDTGAKYQVVIVPGGTKRKSSTREESVVFPVDFVPGVPGSKDPGTQEQGTVGPRNVPGNTGTKSTRSSEEEKPVASPAEESPPGVPFMITAAMRAQLRERGFSDEAIHNMTPQQAHEALFDDVLGEAVASAMPKPRSKDEEAALESLRAMRAARQMKKED